MDKEALEIKKNCISFSWYMRGGVSYEDLMNMSYDERKTISDLIESNLETTKNTKMPFF